MVKFQTVKQIARIILNSDDATKTINNNHTIPIRDPAIVFDGASGPIVSTTLSEIHFNDHKLTTGEAVLYTAGTVAIGGLTTATTYYAIVVNSGVFKLASSLVNATAGTAITLTSAGTGIQTFSRTITFDGSLATIVSVDTESITLANHGLNVADYVQYTTTGTAIVGLAANAYYFIVPIDANTIRLAPTSQDAQNNTNLVNITAVGVGITHNFIKRVAFDSAATLIVDTNNEQIIIPAHGLSVGDRVQYQVDTGNAIGGLTDNEYYHIIVVDADTIRLAQTAALATAGTAINITAVGTGNNHSLTRVVQTPVPVCTNYRFKLQNLPTNLSSNCRLAIRTFDYVKNYNTFNCKSVGGVYLQQISPVDTYNTQGYYKGTLLLPVYFGNTITYQNSDIEFNSIPLSNNISQLLQNGLDIFVDSKKRNHINQDIVGNINEDTFNISLIIYEIEDYDYITREKNDGVKIPQNIRV